MGVASLDLQQTDVGQGFIDYGRIINKPKINGVTLEGNLSTEDINIFIPQRVSELQNDAGYITKNVDDLVYYYDKTEVDNMISTIPKFDIKVVDSLPTEDISPTTIYLLQVQGDDHFEEYIYVDDEWDKLGDGNIDLSDYATYEYVDAELAEKVDAADLATVALSGRYSDLIGTPTNLSQFTNDTGFITAAALPTKTSDLTNDGEDGTSTYVESNELATVATSGSYNDLTDKPTIDFELVEMSYGESNAWAKFIAAYRGHKIVYCRASSNTDPGTGTQGRKAFMAYVNNAENPTEVEFQYVRSVSSKTASQPVDQVFVYKLTNTSGGTWTVQTRNMAPKLAQGTNTTVSYSNGTYTISATQPTVNDATLTIQKNGTTVETFTANSSTNKTANIVVPTKTSDITNDSDFVNSTQVGTALAAYTYPSQDLYTQSDIDTMLAQISSLKIEVVNALPQTGNADTIYLLRVRQQGNDLYQEYFWVNNAWELIGGIDLTDYYTKTEVNTLLTAKADVSAIPTKTSDLTNDSNFAVDANYVHTDNNYTTADKNKLAGIAAGAEVNVQSNWTQTNSSADDFIKNKPSIPTKTSDLTNDSGFITTAAIPTNVSAFNNDAGYLDEIPDDSVGLNQLDSTIVNALNNINNKANTADLAAVAFSGDYDDLTDKPTIPTKTSDLTNDSGFLSSIPIASSSVLGGIMVGSGLSISSGGVLSANGGGTADDVAWGHITGTMSDQTDLTNALAAKANSADLAAVATSGDYDDLTDKPTIGTGLLTLKNNDVVIGTFSANSTSARTITVTTPTKTSDLTNDSGFLTSYTETDPIYSASPAAGITATDISSWNAKSDFSGSYNDLTDKPTIGNATLTVQKNGTSAGTFTANATSNKTINITVPTTAADVSALPASTKYGASITVTIDPSDYKVTTTLKDQDGNRLGPSQTIDLPLESVVVNGRYDSTNKKIVLTLQSGSTIDIPVGDLIAGLQTEITSTNKLSSDLVDDTNHTHKFVTAAQITKLNGIAAGAEVNQNAFSNVKVGTTTVAADTKTDTLELVAGSNVTITPDATNDKVTIAATNTTYSDVTTTTHGLMTAADKVKLNGIATGAEVNVQSDWNQTTTTADDYIKNKPTIPTVNNGQLTIQKNGTNVATFTANQSTNATANITVPTKTSELTNDSSFVTSSGTVAKANQLTTPRTIAISGGATGTATSFSGASNISIPITDVKDAYVTWGGKNITGQTTPIDAAVDPFIGSNKWAFANAASFVYEYSTDGGATWVDCGISDANRRAVTTTAGGYTIRLGNGSTTNYANNKLRLTFNSNAAGGNVYTSLRKILIYLSTNGATGTTVTVTSRTIGNYRNNVDTWATVGTYNVSGWSGWNSIPYDVSFGGGASQTGQIAQIRLTFNQSGGTANMSVSHVHFIGVTNWSVPSELGKTGHLYTWDTSQNATFPANVNVTGSLQHGNYTYTLPNKNGTVAMTSDIPSVPTVNNGKLTIQKNGSNVATFTANQSGNATANITVPTKTSDLTNDSGFVNATAIAGKQDLLTAGAHINITGTTIKATDYVHSEQPVSTSAVTPVVTGNMISNGTITADKLATGATLKLTLSTSDIGEGSALAANTLYGVYQ